jgi:hypothetical protein
MAKARQELADPKTPLDRKAIDLCWVEHLAGDIHQPLHAVSLFSKEYPTGDAGGNLQVLHNDGTLVADVPTINLHFLWDAMEGLSLDPDVIRKDADRIEKEHPVPPDDATVGDVRAWALESFGYAKANVYLDGKLPHITRDQANADPSSAPPLPPDYLKNAQALADQRMAQAGYRLAALLEEIAKGL